MSMAQMVFVALVSRRRGCNPWENEKSAGETPAPRTHSFVGESYILLFLQAGLP
jgi:hypothetical protein